MNEPSPTTRGCGGNGPAKSRGRASRWYDQSGRTAGELCSAHRLTPTPAITIAGVRRPTGACSACSLSAGDLPAASAVFVVHGNRLRSGAPSRAPAETPRASPLELPEAAASGAWTPAPPQARCWGWAEAATAWCQPSTRLLGRSLASLDHYIEGEGQQPLPATTASTSSSTCSTEYCQWCRASASPPGLPPCGGASMISTSNGSSPATGAMVPCCVSNNVVSSPPRGSIGEVRRLDPSRPALLPP